MLAVCVYFVLFFLITRKFGIRARGAMCFSEYFLPRPIKNKFERFYFISDHLVTTGPKKVSNKFPTPMSSTKMRISQISFKVNGRKGRSMSG